MPTTATITTTHKASNNRGLGLIMPTKKKATSKKKKTIITTSFSKDFLD